MCICLHQVHGSRILEWFGRGGVFPNVDMLKKPISKAQVQFSIIPRSTSHLYYIFQTGRVVKQTVTRNAEVGPGGKYTARPASEHLDGSMIKINIPAGWFAFVSGVRIVLLVIFASLNAKWILIYSSRVPHTVKLFN